MRSAAAIATIGFVAVGFVAGGCGGGSEFGFDSVETGQVDGEPLLVSTIARDPTTSIAAPVETDSTEPPTDDTIAPSDTEMPITAGPTAIEPSTTVTATTTTTTAPPDPPPANAALEEIRLGVEQVVDISFPTAIAWRADDASMYVATEDGFVHRVDDGQTELVLDLSAETVAFESGSERGLLGLAFDPRDGRMFLDYTDLENDTRVVSFELVDGVADPASRREVLFIDQPGLGHNGGRLVFDEVGNLLIGSGDGGGSNGRDAQDTTKLFGSLLRVRPALDDDGYEIPEDNPYADGVDDRPEVWARGFRNPWTFSLDDETGDIWVGDVGNDSREEIDVIPGGTNGQNFGWNWFEGSEQRRDDAPEGMTAPVFDYPRSDGVAVMGGHVYRGEEIPELRGAYLFGDLTGPIWAIGESGVTRMDADVVDVLVGWGEDPAGELYLLSLTDGVYRLVRS
ncbi:PQQ-dependent sugar dehydrogenase [Ilumatobacter sp.]|uniref:PQQ-dependent sugar dehydrogenase n=1 Tax=Ilumatobacter sp. TaxID=1967498 RepID=UPI003C483CE4